MFDLENVAYFIRNFNAIFEYHSSNEVDNLQIRLRYSYIKQFATMLIYRGYLVK